jgi:hypothetical protein
LADIKRFSRFAEVLYWYRKSFPDKYAKTPIFREVERALMELPDTELDHGGSGRPMRHWGELLTAPNCDALLRAI